VQPCRVFLVVIMVGIGHMVVIGGHMVVIGHLDSDPAFAIPVLPGGRTQATWMHLEAPPQNRVKHHHKGAVCNRRELIPRPRGARPWSVVT
jgi:hypothetical protein